MRMLARGLVAAVLCSMVAPRSGADAEIVVAIRFLQAKGVSHAHLYLYREDGKLLRQLTRDDSGQDREPVFAPDGETIVFTREKPGGAREIWSVEPRGGGLHRLNAAPTWYRGERGSPFFTNTEPEGGGAPAPNAPRVRAPDGSVELEPRTAPTEEDDQYDAPGHGRHFLLRDLKTGDVTELGKLPGFEGLFDLLHLNTDRGRRFLFEGPLRVAFFDLHFNSTDGDSVYALDIPGRRLVRLSPNWAAPVPLPGEPAFLTYTEVRYVPIAGSKKTANCSYMEHWDARLRRVRYGRDAAAICYGASMYRPGRTPRVVTVRFGN